MGARQLHLRTINTIILVVVVVTKQSTIVVAVNSTTEATNAIQVINNH